MAIDDDLFSPPPPPTTSKKKEEKSSDLFGDDGDLFSSTSKPAPSKSATSKTTSPPLDDNLFLSKPSATGSKKIKKREENDLFDKPPEDIFASGSSVKRKDESGDIFAPTVGGEETKKLDDIFADSAPKKRASEKIKKEVEKKQPPQEEVDSVSLRGREEEVMA